MLLCKIYRTPAPQPAEPELPEVDRKRIRAVVDQAENGYLSPEQIHELLDAAGIARAKEGVADKEEEIVGLARQIGFPLVMKVVGPVHKIRCRWGNPQRKGRSDGTQRIPSDDADQRYACRHAGSAVVRGPKCLSGLNGKINSDIWCCAD